MNCPQKLDELQGNFMAKYETTFKVKVVNSFLAGDGGARPQVGAKILRWLQRWLVQLMSPRLSAQRRTVAPTQPMRHYGFRLTTRAGARVPQSLLSQAQTTLRPSCLPFSCFQHLSPLKDFPCFQTKRANTSPMSLSKPARARNGLTSALPTFSMAKPWWCFPCLALTRRPALQRTCPATTNSSPRQAKPAKPELLAADANQVWSSSDLRDGVSAFFAKHKTEFQGR
jgi:hypothetical protein